MATSCALPVRRRLAASRCCAAPSRLAAPHAVPTAGSYGWPVKPFDRQHPVRGFFGDPRIGEAADGHVDRQTFHFGIDISAPNGTAVYATASRHGRLGAASSRDDRGPEPTTARSIAYWHIVPTVRNGQHAIAYRTVLGHIAKGWDHVHFAELLDGRYVNPLRPGRDRAVRGHDPADGAALRVERTAGARSGRLGGRSILVAEATTRRRSRSRALGRQARHACARPLAPPRTRAARRPAGEPRSTTRATIPAPERFDCRLRNVDAPEQAWRPGRYRF